MAKGTVDIVIQKCKGRGLCVANCPTNALGLSRDINGKGFHFAEIQKDTCIGCTNCALVCPDAVITVYRAKKEA